MFKLAVILAALGTVLGLPSNSHVPFMDSRIVGGEETDIAQNPWQLALLYHSQHFCGAVEIHPDWAITAAHCLEGAKVDHLSVRAGSTTKSFGGQVVNVVRTYTHPNYNRRSADYDFALLELAESITVQSASPAALPDPNADVNEGEITSISGWGLLSEHGASTEILQIVDVPVLGHVVCQRQYIHHPITDRMFCTGDLKNGGRDACLGDSGGPVIIAGKLVGLVSWGTGCAEAKYPGVQAKVSAVVGWIYDTSGI